MRFLFNKSQFISHFAMAKKKRDHRIAFGWILNQKKRPKKRYYITSEASILKHYANSINFNMLLTYRDIPRFLSRCVAIIYAKLLLNNNKRGLLEAKTAKNDGVCVREWR
jgi:hypothetical protein